MCSARTTAFPCLALAVLVVLSAQAFADFTRVAVTPPGVPSCEGQYYAVFTTIQSAVNSVPAGGTIFVCPGVYAEQVMISKKLILQGTASSTQNEAVIVPPAGGMMQNATDLVTGNPIAAQILVTAGTVTINSLSVDGTGNGLSGCSPDLRGILYQNASGTVDHVAVRNEIPGGIPGSCSTGGEGIFVQSSTGTANVIVETSSVHSYNTNGITGNGPGTNLTASGNYVHGSGVVSGGPVQNGIQLGFGAKGKITLNTVSDNIYESAVPAAADILLYDTAENSSIAVTNNVLSNSQLPLGLETSGDDGANLGDGVTVTGNKISGALGDAIDVCTNGNAISTNTIFGSAQSAVHFDTSCGLYFGGSTGTKNNATKNTFVESACAGILDDTGGTGGNVTSPANVVYTVPFPSAYSTASCPFAPKEEVHTGAKGRDTKVSPRR
jgi:hypothetical protein